MREIVCLGTKAETVAFVELAREAADEFLRLMDLPVEWLTATDPFFQPQSNPKYLFQRLQPVKHEATYGGDLAIASLNRHHDHFGTAFAITRDGAPAHSACLAFGLERWLFAITHRHGTDPRSWPRARGSSAESEGTPMTGNHADHRGRRLRRPPVWPPRCSRPETTISSWPCGPAIPPSSPASGRRWSATLPSAAARPDQFRRRGPAPRRGTGPGRQAGGHTHRARRRRHPLQRRVGRGPERQRRGHGAARRVRWHVSQPAAPGLCCRRCTARGSAAARWPSGSTATQGSPTTTSGRNGPRNRRC